MDDEAADDPPVPTEQRTVRSGAPDVSGLDIGAAPDGVRGPAAEHGEPGPGAGPANDDAGSGADDAGSGAGDGSEVDDDADRPMGAPSRRALTFVVAPLIVLWIAARLGDVFAATLLPDPDEPGSGNPYLLLVLSPNLRYQVGVVNYVNPVLFFVLATFRLMVSDPPFYLLGRWYGESAVRWMERRSAGAGRFLRDAEGIYGKLAYPLVAIAPNNLICLLAGSSRMRPAVFVALNLGGTIVRLWLVVQFGEAFADQIDWVLELIGRYRWWLVGASAVVVAGAAMSQARRGTGEIAQLRELEHEVERNEHEEDT